MTRDMAGAGALLILAVFGVACASAPSEEPDFEIPPAARRILVTFSVDNHLEPRAAVTIRLLDGETTRILGSVTPGQERAFELELPAEGPEYRLTATSTAFDDAIASKSFSLSVGSVVNWRISDNVLVVGQRPEDAP